MRNYAVEYDSYEESGYCMTSVDIFSTGTEEEMLADARKLFNDFRNNLDRSCDRSARLLEIKLEPGESIRVYPAAEEANVTVCNKNVVVLEEFEYKHDTNRFRRN